MSSEAEGKGVEADEVDRSIMWLLYMGFFGLVVLLREYCLLPLCLPSSRKEIIELTRRIGFLAP